MLHVRGGWGTAEHRKCLAAWAASLPGGYGGECGRWCTEHPYGSKLTYGPLHILVSCFN